MPYCVWSRSRCCQLVRLKANGAYSGRHWPIGFGNRVVRLSYWVRQVRYPMTTLWSTCGTRFIVGAVVQNQVRSSAPSGRRHTDASLPWQSGRNQATRPVRGSRHLDNNCRQGRDLAGPSRGTFERGRRKISITSTRASVSHRVPACALDDRSLFRKSGN